MTQITTFGSAYRLDVDDGAAQTRERRRFRTAMVLSGCAHVLVVALLYLLWQPIGDEVVPLPPIPVTVVQAPEGQSGAAGGGNSETAASAPSAASPSASASEATSSAAEPPQPQQPTPPVETPKQPASEIPSLAQTAVTPAPAPQEALEPVPVRKPTPPQPKPRPVPTETAQRAPTPPTPEPAPQQAQTATATPAQTASAAGSDQPLPPGLGGRGRGEEGAGRAAIGNGSLNGPGDDYLGALQRWLARFRVYPDEAKKQKQEGVAMIGFTLARDGTVLKAWIAKSSGYPLLDQAALKMMHDASPVPKVPDRYQGETLTLTIPENFHMGLFDRLFH